MILPEHPIYHFHQYCILCIVIRVGATHVNEFGNDVDSQAAGGLSKVLPICIGARVMLTENIWTENGLNGSIGIVEDLGWDRPSGINPRRIAPEVIMVRFEGYMGPSYYNDDTEMSKIVPIFPSKRGYLHGNKLCSRTQFPLTIAYTITVYKPQGITLDQVVADLSSKGFAVGLTYVTVSRVRTLQGLMFDGPFDHSDVVARTDSEGGSRE
ncbi:unnamed protein product [Clonostachys rhizophaga]|uniref:Uncharacterized protein n=1 Tax=Clonostachys rhizophaga TaxID=160324 RepID=A0A9N9YK00_9HYPO|nr:unnamed protein product [Clonostachys rhizophaga]